MPFGLIRKVKAQTKGVIRRQRDRFFPDRTTRDYRTWISAHMARRAKCYAASLEPGLLSIITAVWDGSPVPYLRQLANSLAVQISGTEAQWFILANGCSRSQLRTCLAELARYSFVTVHYLPQNAGIVGGLRQCLERANGRYILPVDADDLLYPDALQIATRYIQQHGYPPLLYSDEDKVSGSGFYQPYFKPDWDPVLLANSAYIAHLGIIRRDLALSFDAYGDKQAEGSADWDLFTRFANAGQGAVHIPEVLYSWRIHAQSTADDAASKPYIVSSQEAVLSRLLAAHPNGSNFSVQPSQLFGAGAAHLRLLRRAAALPAFELLKGPGTLADLLAPARDMARKNGFLALVNSNLQADPALPDWPAEALGLFELFPDTIMVGGRISDGSGVVVDGPRTLGFGALYDCPDAGRSLTDPGYFGQLWKARTVSAVSASFAMIKASQLLRILPDLPGEASLQHLGLWIAADARRGGTRIVYSPYLHAWQAQPQPDHVSPAEEQAFRALHADLLPDRRFYPPPFSLARGYAIDLERSEPPDQPQSRNH